MSRYNLIQAPVGFLIETFYEQLWGFKPKLIRAFIRQKGAVRSLFWFIPNTLKYESTLEQWGHVHTHVLVTTLSALNDCPYSVFGHAFALGLAYLKQTGNLFPLNESEMVGFCGQSEAEILMQMSQALEVAGLSQEIMSVQRIVELRRSPELAMTKQDHRLLHLIKMFYTLNACALRANVKRDQAHDALNKDRGIRDRYITLRKSQHTQMTMVQPLSVQSVKADTTVLNPADVAAPVEIEW